MNDIPEVICLMGVISLVTALSMFLVCVYPAVIDTLFSNVTWAVSYTVIGFLLAIQGGVLLSIGMSLMGDRNGW